MAIDSDLELMMRVQNGDAESFELLLNRYRLPLVSYFVRMVRDRALAEDLAQEVFLRVYQARQRYQPEARFTTWLYRIATNLALNALRDRKSDDAPALEEDGEGVPRVARTADSRPTAEEQLMLSDRERLIREAIESLPEKQRAAVILQGFDGALAHLQDLGNLPIIPRGGLSANCQGPGGERERRQILAFSSL